MKKSVIILFVFIFIIVLYVLFDYYMRTQFSVIAEEECTKIISNSINDASYEIISNGVTYEELITIKQDETGKIALVQSDTMKMNLLGSKVSKLAEEMLDEKSKSSINIPFAYLMGGQLFFEKTPEIKVRFRQIGNASTEFTSEFISAGINQTIHRINMNVKIDALVLIPNYNKKINMTVAIPVCETIIVGTVPEDYMSWFNKSQ